MLGSSLGGDDPAASVVAVSTEETATETSLPAAPKPVLDEFGIPTGAFRTSDRPIRRNETFAQILADYDVPYGDAVTLASLSELVMDVRRIQAGKSLRLYQDSSSAVHYLVYEQDPVRYVVFNLQDSLSVYAKAREVDVRERLVGGAIDGSLYSALTKEGADPALVDHLAELFAWQVDFHRIQQGDAFQVLYEEQLVEGKPFGAGRILGARFNHRGEDHYAIAFEMDGRTAYFDEEGQSLRKLLLKSPLKFSRISSRYSTRRFHPVQKRYKAHLGTDYAAPTGTPILAVGDGVVLEAQRKQHNGNYVKIRHNATYTTGYLHLSRFAEGMKPGKVVRQGEVIGYVGSTGLATGPHVCYRFWKKGQQVDPLKEALPPSAPVPDAYRAAFEAARNQVLPRLKQTTRTSLASF
ncbi:MAG: peptidoglycan DD-metalloendopeptidase family protein [Rhodothermales bacterium]